MGRGVSPSLLLLQLSLIVSVASASSPLAPQRLRVNGLDAPLAVLASAPAPVFSWTLRPPPATPAARALVQASFRLQVSLLALNFSGALVCDALVSSADPATDDACAAQLAAPGLAGAQLLWRVCAEASVASPSACADAAAAPWSAPAALGLAPDAAQWAAAGGFVAATRATQGGSLSRAVRLRAVAAPPPAGTRAARAVLYVASAAYYEAHSGGARVDAPRASAVTTHTAFARRLYYEAYDVTAALSPQAGLAVGLRVGGGPWACAKFAASNGASGLPVRALVVYSDAANGAVLAAPALKFRAAADSVLATDWYNGEDIDARKEGAFAGWDTLAFDDSAWADVEPNDMGVAAAELEPQPQPPVAQLVDGREGTEAPVSVAALPAPGRYVFSFAQMFAGTVELDVPAAGATGQTVRLLAGERLYANGSVWNQLNYGSNQTLNWTLAGAALETLRPVFLFWGFQFLEVSGWPSSAPPPTVASLRGVATSTLSRRAARIAFAGVEPSPAIAAGFAAALRHEPRSRPGPRDTALLLNASILAGVMHAAAASQAANFQALPSDCPNREKRGWLGDAAVSALQASTLFDMGAPYYAWTRSHGDDQARNAERAPLGLIDNIVPSQDPDVGPPAGVIDAAWALGAVETVYQSVRHFGELRTLASRWGGMVALVEYLTNHTDPATKVMRSQSIFGDLDANFSRVEYVNATREMCATGAFLRMLSLLARLAPLAGHPEQSAAFRAALAAAAAPFNAYYALDLSRGLYGDGIEQTLAVIPLSLGLVPAANLAAVQQWLVHDVETTRAMHLTTGATGTRFFFEALSSMGRTDLAAAVAAQDSFPSHGWWITQGATSCWENWSGEAGADHPPPPTHNHIFLCSHVGWQFEFLLGVSVPPVPSSLVAYATVKFTPPLIDSLPAMSGAIESVRGRVALDWAWQAAPMASPFRLNASLPPASNGSVSVPVPGLSNPTVTESGAVVWRDGAFVPGVAGVTGAERSGSYVVFDIGSGDYTFETSSAATPVIVSACAAAASSERVRLEVGPAFEIACPASGTARLARFMRAGLVEGPAAAAGFADAHSTARVAGAVRHRFLLTHVLERLCAGHASCRPTWAAIEAAASPAGASLAASRREAAAHVCVVAACED